MKMNCKPVYNPSALLLLLIFLAAPSNSLAFPPFGEGPMLVAEIPTDGATGVAPATALMLIFSAPMASSQAVQWSPNIDPAKVSYSWGFGNLFLTVQYAGGWPGSATINYTLNPAGVPPGFKDEAGTPLPTTSRSFATGGGGGPGDPCEPGGAPSAGLFMGKFVSYEQTSDAAPQVVGGLDGGAIFSASLQSPTNNPVTAVSLTIPGGRIVTLSNFFGSFIHFESFATPAQLDAAYPAGVYTANITRANGGSQNGTLTLPANVNVPVPRLSNYPQLSGFNAAQNFNFLWDPFTGAGANDSISFQVNDSTGREFHAPDLCVPRELAVTATSMVLPANTLAANTGNEGSLAFSRGVVQDQNFLPDIPAFASVSKSTQFKFAPGGTSTKPEFVGIDRSPAGVVTLRVKIQSGARYAIEFTTDFQTWVSVHNATAAGDPVVVTHTPAATDRAGFYRAVILP